MQEKIVRIEILPQSNYNQSHCFDLDETREENFKSEEGQVYCLLGGISEYESERELANGRVRVREKE